jgi:hypothetical protein
MLGSSRYLLLCVTEASLSLYSPKQGVYHGLLRIHCLSNTFTYSFHVWLFSSSFLACLSTVAILGPSKSQGIPVICCNVPKKVLLARTLDYFILQIFGFVWDSSHGSFLLGSTLTSTAFIRPFLYIGLCS